MTKQVFRTRAPLKPIPRAAALLHQPRKGKKPVRWAGDISTTKRQLMRLARKAKP
jgi:hypothetical protein